MAFTTYLKEVPLFSNFSDETLERFSDKTQLHEFRKGEVIIREGDIDDRLYILIEGECSAVIGLGRKNERHLEKILRYSYFGEMSLIDELARSASVVADTNVKALSIDRLNLNKEILKNPQVAMDLLKTLSLRVRGLNMAILSSGVTKLPICLKCYKMRNANNQWVSVEKYMWDYSEAQANQPICPECHGKHFSPV